MDAPATYLFVPGNRPERFDKALASGADAIILDLEDAVLPNGKDAARAHVGEWLDRRGDARDRVVVRINGAGTPWFDADLALLAASRARFAMLPKSEHVTDLAALKAALTADGQMLPLIESARGVENVAAVAAAPGVQRLVFGTLDYAVDLDLSGDDRGLVYPGSRIALASRCAGLISPVAGVTPSIDDHARLLADLAFARALGFGAKLCIHPKQVEAIRAALAPTDEEIGWARCVLAAAEGSTVPCRWTAGWSTGRWCSGRRRSCGGRRAERRSARPTRRGDDRRPSCRRAGGGNARWRDRHGRGG
jgi:citrate lyase subunit beta/citryl-CoA lyase